MIRSLQTETVKLHYRNLGSDDSLKIVIFADAAHGKLPDERSQGRDLIFLVGDNGACSLIGWTSKRIKRVVKSSLAAETLSVSEAVDAVVYANTMFSEINYEGTKRLPTEVVADNKSLCDALHSNKSVTDKRLRIEIGSLKEMLQTKDIVKVHWVETK